MLRMEPEAHARNTLLTWTPEGRMHGKGTSKNNMKENVNGRDKECWPVLAGRESQD